MTIVTPRIPHNARTAAVLGEVLRILSTDIPWDSRESVGENWQAIAEQGDQCRKLLIREVKTLDHELFTFRELLGLDNDQSEDAIITRAIADLDPGE